jgi:hypothetical protein
VRLFDNASRWLVFALVAVAMSYALRAVAALATRAGARKLDAARKALGLAPLPTGSKRNTAPAEPTAPG